MTTPSMLPARRYQRGAALLTALVLMLAVLMTGIASTRAALQGARAAAHERDRVLALQMADAALRDAERDIEGGLAPGSARAAAFATGQASAFAAGCRASASYSGLCMRVSDPQALGALLAEADGPAVAYGAHTGAAMPDGGAGLPAQAPRYLVELMPPANGAHLYRITARGSGAMPGTRSAVQAFYRKPPHGAMGRRVGWRELGNWSESHGAN